MSRLGKNIRSLRMAYGETQEQLGAALFLEKNTVSYYENGKRVPSQEIIAAIAKHYMVSVDELLHSDCTIDDRVIFEEDIFSKNIEVFFPIVSTDTAINNKDFNKAYDTHRKIYDDLHRGIMDGFDRRLDVCLNRYQKASKDNNAVEEASVNTLALIYLSLYSTRTTLMLWKDRPAALTQLALKNEKLKKLIEDPDFSWEEDVERLSREDEEELSDILTIVKKSRKWADLADYYLALKYVWNLVDNDLDQHFNKRIGIEMMISFCTVNNVYAARFIQLCVNAMHGHSSQSVDDDT